MPYQASALMASIPTIPLKDANLISDSSESSPWEPSPPPTPPPPSSSSSTSIPMVTPTTENGNTNKFVVPSLTQPLTNGYIPSYNPNLLSKNELENPPDFILQISSLLVFISSISNNLSSNVNELLNTFNIWFDTIKSGSTSTSESLPIDELISKLEQIYIVISTYQSSLSSLNFMNDLNNVLLKITNLINDIKFYDTKSIQIYNYLMNKKPICLKSAIDEEYVMIHQYMAYLLKNILFVRNLQWFTIKFADMDSSSFQLWKYSVRGKTNRFVLIASSPSSEEHKIIDKFVGKYSHVSDYCRVQQGYMHDKMVALRYASAKDIPSEESTPTKLVGTVSSSSSSAMAAASTFVENNAPHIVESSNAASTHPPLSPVMSNPQATQAPPQQVLEEEDINNLMDDEVKFLNTDTLDQVINPTDSVIISNPVIEANSSSLEISNEEMARLTSEESTASSHDSDEQSTDNNDNNLDDKRNLDKEFEETFHHPVPSFDESDSKRFKWKGNKKDGVIKQPRKIRVKSKIVNVGGNNDDDKETNKDIRNDDDDVKKSVKKEQDEDNKTCDAQMMNKVKKATKEKNDEVEEDDDKSTSDIKEQAKKETMGVNDSHEDKDQPSIDTPSIDTLGMMFQQSVKVSK